MYLKMTGLSECVKKREVALVESRNEEPVILLTPRTTELAVKGNVWTSSILVKDQKGTDVYMK